MHPALLVLLFLLPPSPSAAQTPPREFIQVSRPLPFDSYTPSCTQTVLSHAFGLPSAVATYSPPPNCAWSRAVLQLSAAANGSHHYRIASVWLSGSEILRTTTPKPTPDGIFWNVIKDVSRYSFLLRQINISLAVVLDNQIDDGIYALNLTLFYYGAARTRSNLVPLPLFPGMQPKDPFNLDESPADLIIPVSKSGEQGFWFKIENENDAVYQGIQIPPNTYRAVLEVYVSSHENDEFWYSNPPDAYITMNNLDTEKGNGVYREVIVKIDDTVVGSIIPFPVIYAGGINPLFWKPVVSIGAFDLPCYLIELTPFLGTLHDGKQHSIGVAVSNAISYWLIDENLHLWLDSAMDRVEAGVIRYHNPESHVERNNKFHGLNGKFQTDGRRAAAFSGWVRSSAGNLTTEAVHKFWFENSVHFNEKGLVKQVYHKVEVDTEVKVMANTVGISDVLVERKDRLKIKSNNTVSGVMITELENGSREKKDDKNAKSRMSVANIEKCNGWMAVRDEGVLLGSATTYHEYQEKDRSNCYKRRVFVEAGSVKNDTTSPCSRVAIS